MLFRRKKTIEKQKLAFDPAKQEPVIRCSICTGEQVAGLKDLDTNTFHEIMLIRDERDLEMFKEMAGVETVRKEY